MHTDYDSDVPNCSYLYEQKVKPISTTELSIMTLVRQKNTTMAKVKDLELHDLDVVIDTHYP